MFQLRMSICRPEKHIVNQSHTASQGGLVPSPMCLLPPSGGLSWMDLEQSFREMVWWAHSCLQASGSGWREILAYLLLQEARCPAGTLMERPGEGETWWRMIISLISNHRPKRFSTSPTFSVSREPSNNMSVEVWVPWKQTGASIWIYLVVVINFVVLDRLGEL